MSTLREAIEKSIAASELKEQLSPKAGAVIAVAGAETLEVFQLGSGITADTPVEIGSLTKAFTALLVADAILRQELQLSTRLDHLLFSETWPDSPAINIEQLVTHTSGLPRLSMPVSSILLHPSDPYRKYDAAHLMDYLQQEKPRGPVDPKFSYSNLGYAVLGLMLEKATAKTYEQLLHERILALLNMSETSLQLPEKPDRPAKGYARNGQSVSLWHMDAYAPCGAMVSTVTDLVAAVRGILNPGNLLASALDLTVQPRTAIPGGNIGMGWILPASGNSFWHNGATAGYTSYLGIYAPRKTGVIVVANQALPKEATELGHQMMRDIAQNQQGASL